MRQNLVHQLMKADVQIVEAQSVGEDPCLKLQKLKVSMDEEKPQAPEEHAPPVSFLHTIHKMGLSSI